MEKTIVEVRKVLQNSDILNSTCPFCSPDIKSRIIAEFCTVFAIRDGYPVTSGHTLIIPYRHTIDFFTMTMQEKSDVLELIKRVCADLSSNDKTIMGFNIGMNCGEAAGQSVMHAHIHIIPRREGDVPNPKGGVRGVIPGKMGY